MNQRSDALDVEYRYLEDLDEKSRIEVTNHIKQCLDLYFKQLGNSRGVYSLKSDGIQATDS